MSLFIDINKRYKNFSINIKMDTDGSPVGFLGASGGGKSLTLKCIAGIVTPDQGRIVLNGRVLYDSERRINLIPQKRCIGYMFQNYALFPNMTVRENIEIAVKKKNKKVTADKMLELLRIGHLQNRYPNQLSGGEQQRVALARMFAYEPEAMLFDEPFSALDAFLKDQLQQELLEVLREYPNDILMVSHSRDELYRFCKSVAIISQGQIIEYGNRDEVFGKPTDVFTAKLTGCKNISRTRWISDYEVEALDWGVCLKTKVPVEKDICHVGIRAHNILAVDSNISENIVPVILAGYSEGPFEFNLIMKSTLSKRTDQEGGKLWWIVSRQEWIDGLKEQLPKVVSLPSERLLLLKDKLCSKSY